MTSEERKAYYRRWYANLTPEQKKARAKRANEIRTLNPEQLERKRATQRAYQRRQRAMLTPEELEVQREKDRLRAEARRRAAGIEPRKPAAPRVRVKHLNEKPVKTYAPVKTKVPTELKRAWTVAHPNSIIRQKWPTRKALEKHFEEAA